MRRITFEIPEGVTFIGTLLLVVGGVMGGVFSLAYYAGKDSQATSFVQENDGLIKVLWINSQTIFIEGTTNQERKSIRTNKIVVPGETWTISDQDGYFYLGKRVEESE